MHLAGIEEVSLKSAFSLYDKLCPTLVLPVLWVKLVKGSEMPLEPDVVWLILPERRSRVRRLYML